MLPHGFVLYACLICETAERAASLESNDERESFSGILSLLKISNSLSIGFGGTWAARDGQPVADYDEAPVAKHLAGQDIRIEVDLGLGEGRATVWTCDLTHGYISINADYRS